MRINKIDVENTEECLVNVCKIRNLLAGFVNWPSSLVWISSVFLIH